MNLRRAIACSLVVVAAANVLGCGVDRSGSPTTQAVGSAGLIRYDSQWAGVELVYPPSWHPMKDDTVVTLVPIAEKAIGRNVVVVDMPDLPPHFPGLIPMALVENGFVNDLYDRFSDVKVDDKSDRTVCGVTGRQVMAHGMNAGHPVKVVATLLVRGDHVYVIDAACDSELADSARTVYEGIIGSWKWLN